MTNSGFTLVELLATLAILVIFLALGVPSFVETMANQRVRSQADGMLASLALARSESIRQNIRVSLCPSSNGTSCTGSWSDGWIVFSDTGTAGTVDGADSVLRAFSSKKDVTVSMGGNFTNYISYLPSGRSSGSGGATTGGAISISGDNLIRDINICTTGRIQSGGSC